jgi:hypothetical protein
MTHQADVLIHVDAATRSHEVDFMRGMLMQIDGVTTVHASARPQLLQVSYDPDRTRGRAILDHVRRFGVSAQLVGL